MASVLWFAPKWVRSECMLSIFACRSCWDRQDITEGQHISFDGRSGSAKSWKQGWVWPHLALMWTWLWCGELEVCLDVSTVLIIISLLLLVPHDYAYHKTSIAVVGFWHQSLTHWDFMNVLNLTISLVFPTLSLSCFCASYRETDTRA